jgi:thioredoxin-related protein
MSVVEKRKKVFAVTIIMLTLAAMYLIPFSYTAAVAGNLEPTAPPASTRKTLNEIPPTWSQNLPVGYDPKRNPHRDLEQAKSIAKNRKILMIVGGDWCEWCYILDNFLKDNPELYNNLKNNFVILKVHWSQENKNSEFLSDFQRSMVILTSSFSAMMVSILESRILGCWKVLSRIQKNPLRNL